MILPDKLFFTGAPGSGWSGIAQHFETNPAFNTSDRKEGRSYEHNLFSGHKGSYFGMGMEFEAILDNDNINQAWQTHEGTKIVKSHEWAYKLDEVRERFPNDWIMLISKPPVLCFEWWKKAGGWSITYPSYAAYKDDATMLNHIDMQNRKILKFAAQNNLTWSNFTSEWIKENFDLDIDIHSTFNATSAKVTLLK